MENYLGYNKTEIICDNCKEVIGIDDGKNYLGEDKPLTATQLQTQEVNKEYYHALKEDLEIVLEFVERWNKQDKEKNVAESAQRLKQFRYLEVLDAFLD